MVIVVRRPSKQRTSVLPAWIVEPFARHYITAEQFDADDMSKLRVAYLFGDAVNLWLKAQGLRIWQEEIGHLPQFYPAVGEPTNDGPPRELLASVFANARRNPQYARWFRALGIAHDSDVEVAS